MKNQREWEEIAEKIRLMQSIAGELSDRAAAIPALERNIARIQASLRVLELDFSDALDCPD